jgi:hypothetical protein
MAILTAEQAFIAARGVAAALTEDTLERDGGRRLPLDDHRQSRSTMPSRCASVGCPGVCGYADVAPPSVSRANITPAAAALARFRRMAGRARI